ncbi:MAG: sugar phosphate isomerase/epimerase [Planctomycetaceae bacterium]|nr:sugar phosphate isomerase/epimerase [Planctomycetaceae bacterium]
MYLYERSGMKKSLSVETMFDDVPFYDRFAKARAAGFDWVEFSAWTSLEFSRITDALAEHHLRLASIAGAEGQSLADPDQRDEFLEFLSQSIAVAKSFDCTNLIIETGAKGLSGRLAAASHQDFVKASAATRTLDDAARKATRAGVTLYLKPVRDSKTRTLGLDTIPSSGEVVRMVGSPALRLLMDVGTADSIGGADSALKRYGDLIGYVHIGNTAVPSLPAIRRTLTTTGFDGFVGFSAWAESGDPLLEQIRQF